MKKIAVRIAKKAKIRICMDRIDQQENLVMEFVMRCYFKLGVCICFLDIGKTKTAHTLLNGYAPLLLPRNCIKVCR